MVDSLEVISLSLPAGRQGIILRELNGYFIIIRRKMQIKLLLCPPSRFCGRFK
jgi:hypothetical protein